MPTIEQLEPVIVASDDDELPVSQRGILRRASRSKLLAGMQPTISLNPGLLGRTSPGFGAPEHIGIGGSLTLVNGVLSSPPRFSVAALPQGLAVNAGDLVAVTKGGIDTAVPISALLSAADADVSGQVVKAQVGSARKLSAWAGDAISVEAFGAVGDGQVDDSAAFARALASGQPLRLGAKTYRIEGQWTITVSAAFIGVPGASILRRTRQTGGAWISISAPSFTAIGVTFDAGAVPGDSWAVQIDAKCTTTLFDTCTFMNARGPSLGTGLTIQARDGLTGSGSNHTVQNCVFYNNAVHGLWVQAACGATITNCTSYNNGSYGICLDFNDPALSQVVRQCSISGCRSWGNTRGISVGNYNETNLEPPRWGPANPDARQISITNNVCFDNVAYGIAVAGHDMIVNNNAISIAGVYTTASGILFNASSSQVSGNCITGKGEFGIDCGGCIDVDVTDNIVDGFRVGINGGGGKHVRILGNRIANAVRGITVFQVETDGRGNNFGLQCNDLLISNNQISLASAGSVGVSVVDGPQNVRLISNNFTAPGLISADNAVSLHTDQAVVVDNSWNGSWTCSADIVEIDGLSYIRSPEIADEMTLSIPATTSVAGLVGQHQFDVAGLITFIRVVRGGSGYLHATVTITGDGSGAQASAYVRDGAVIGIAIHSGGSGYVSANTFVSIVGDGQGAMAVAQVGLPVLEGRRLTIAVSAPLGLRMDGSVAQFDNWTGEDLTIAGRTEVVCVGTNGRWRTVSFVAIDNLVPGIDGGVVLRSRAGDVTLLPRGGGAVRVASDTEELGFVTALGRGSPEGVVTANPGSDYRNLDGGTGQTLWLKRSGDGKSGWFAVC